MIYDKNETNISGKVEYFAVANKDRNPDDQGGPF